MPLVIEAQKIPINFERWQISNRWNKIIFLCTIACWAENHLYERDGSFIWKERTKTTKPCQLLLRNIVVPSPQLNIQWVWSNIKQKGVQDTHPEIPAKPASISAPVKEQCFRWGFAVSCFWTGMVLWSFCDCRSSSAFQSVSFTLCIEILNWKHFHKVEGI